LIVDLFFLITKLAHDIVAGVLSLIGYSVHHTQTIGLVLGLTIDV